MIRPALRVVAREPEPAPLSPDIETMSRKQLQRLQLDRLRRLLRHACANSAYYRRSFEHAGVKPSDLHWLGDLAAFPFTSRADLVGAYPFGLLAVPRARLTLVDVQCTATDRPVLACYTASDLANRTLLMARSLACAGVLPGDVVYNARADKPAAKGLDASEGARRLGCMVVSDPVGSAHQATVVADLDASVLFASPSQALAIADAAERIGVALRASSLRLGIFGSEPSMKGLRAELESRLGLTALDLYGLRELMGLGVACECFEARSGLHGWEDHFLFEVIDPATGEPLAPGETGELVVTTLTMEAQPFIRYRTGDLARLVDAACSCGRTHVRIVRDGAAPAADSCRRRQSSWS